MPALAVFGGLLTIAFFLSGCGIYSVGKSAIHEIYGSVLIMTSMISLLMTTVAIAANQILRQLRHGPSI